MRQLHHVQPARDERACARGDDGPGRAGGFEVGEERAGAGDFDRVGAVPERDLAFGCADVCGKDLWLAWEGGLLMGILKRDHLTYNPSWPAPGRVV